MSYYYLLILTQGGDSRLKNTWTGQEPGGINPDPTLEPGDAPLLFHHDRKDHVVNKGGKWIRQGIEGLRRINRSRMNEARHTRPANNPILLE